MSLCDVEGLHDPALHCHAGCEDAHAHNYVCPPGCTVHPAHVHFDRLDQEALKRSIAWGTIRAAPTGLGRGPRKGQGGFEDAPHLVVWATYERTHAVTGQPSKLFIPYTRCAPCVSCKEPVTTASVGGTALCPWCDSGHERRAGPYYKRDDAGNVVLKDGHATFIIYDMQEREVTA